MPYPELPAAVYRRLRAHIEGEVRVDHPLRALYSTDASIYQIFPLAVVFPRSVADLEALLAVASESGTPVIARGGGTGLAGEAVGEAIMADCSRWLTAIPEVDAGAGLVRVEGGVVLERLNHRLAPLGKQFGPDPGSATRCTVGGMVANNAAGMHSLLHGVTRDNVLCLDLVLSDGSRVEVGPSAARPAPGTLAHRIYLGLERLLREHAALIEAKTPRRLKRHRAGYLLHDVVSPTPDAAPSGAVPAPDLAKVICGSEGTLAFVASATLRIVDRLKETGVGLFSFREVAQAADAVRRILPHGPSAVEMLDLTILRMAREANRLPGDLAPRDAKSVLMVEFAGESRKEIADRLERLRHDLRANSPVLDHVVFAHEPAEKQRIWAVRSSGEPLLNRRPGRHHAVSFVEDVAVEPERLGEYVRALEGIFGPRGVAYAAYGHAGVGVLHVRPFLDLRDREDLRKMEECAEEIYDAALAMGGSISGEHGDGLARTYYLRKQYGPLYPVFGEVKALFDPRGILNPDKIWRPEPRNSLLENLRAGADYGYRETPTRLVWGGGELGTELDKCNGCGECKGLGHEQSMCTAHKERPEEAASPRAKANLVRALAGGRLDPAFFGDPDVKAILDTCVNCKACRMECPVGVNVPKLVMEAKAEYVGRNGQSWANLLLEWSDRTSALCALAGRPARPLFRSAAVRKVMEWATGIDARRPLPPFVFTPLERFQAACPRPARPAARVAVFLDLYGRYNEPALIFDFLDVLRANDVEAIVPAQRASGLPAMAYAGVTTARATVEANARAFSRAIDDGYTVVAIEPSAALAVVEEAPAFSSDRLVAKLAAHATDAMRFLAGLLAEGKLRTRDLAPLQMRVGRHVPCHVRALGAEDATTQLLAAIPGLEVYAAGAGCCGIAGTWGMKRENYDRSMRMGAGLFEALRDPAIGAGLSECSTCRMQMEHGMALGSGEGGGGSSRAGRRRKGKRAFHPITLLARAYREGQGNS